MAGERRYLGIGEESTFGTAVPAASFIDYLRANLEAPTDSLLYYEGSGGRAQALAMPGPYIPSGDLEVGVDPVESGFLVKWALKRYGQTGTADAASTTLAADASAGDTTIVVNAEAGFLVNDYVQIDAGIGGSVVKITALDGGAGPTYTWTVTALLNAHLTNAAVQEVIAPFTHIFRPTNDDNLPSFTARIGKGVFEHVFAGASIDRLSYAIERGFLTVTASLQAQKDTKANNDAAAKSFASTIYTFRHGTTLIASVDETDIVESFNLEIANNIDAESGVRFGSRFPREFQLRGVDVTGTYRLAFKDQAEYTRFWGDAGGAVEGGASTFKIEQQFNIGGDWLKFILGSCYWTQIGTPVSGRDIIRQDISFKAIVDSTFGLLTIEIINSKDRY